MPDDYKDSLRVRIGRAIRASGKEYSTIAKDCGVRTNAIYGWLKTGRIAKDTLRRLADSTSTTVEWLISGDEGAVVATDAVMIRVPIMDWSGLGYDSKQKGELTIVSQHHVDAECFALIAQGSAMAGEFPNGSAVIVNPRLDPEPGRFVVADTPRGAVLRQLQVDGGSLVLRAIDPGYPAIHVDDETKILGVVVALQKSYL